MWSALVFAVVQIPSTVLTPNDAVIGEKRASISSACESSGPFCGSRSINHEKFDRNPKSKQTIEDLDAKARGFIVANQHLLGSLLPDANLLIDHISESEINGIPRTSISYEQRYRGIRVYNGEVVFSFANNELIFISGSLFSSETTIETDFDLTSIDVLDSRPCASPASAETVFERRFGQVVELRHCPKSNQFIDPKTGKVLAENSVLMNWDPGAGSVVSIGDGSSSGIWFFGPVTLANAAQCTLAAMPCTTAPLRRFVRNTNLDISGDLRRLSYRSYGGSDSVTPYPATYIDASHIWSGTAAALVDANAYGATGLSVASAAHERISGVATYVQATPTGLWAFRGPNEYKTLRVYTYATNDGCGGLAHYNPNQEDICLNFTYVNGFDWSRTPIHEYGHYVHDSYGLHGSTCDEIATQEGVADALSLSLTWARYNPTPGYDRYISDPGLTRPHVPDGSFFAPVTDTYTNIARVSQQCGGNDGNKYAKGMAISQTLWSLLNNQWCNRLSGACSYEAVLPGYSAAQAGLIGRQTLTITMDDTGNEAPINEFLREWWYNLYYAVNWESVWNLRQLFLQHETALPNQAPLGNLDAATRTGATWTFSGWACDKDTPANPERQIVHVYIGGQIFRDVVANQSSENAVAEACGDPTYKSHRFSFTIPNSEIRARVGAGFRNLDMYALDSDLRNGTNVNFSSGRIINISPLY